MSDNIFPDTTSWHRVPDETTIPKGMPFVRFIQGTLPAAWVYYPEGLHYEYKGAERLVEEPFWIPKLPTEVGARIYNVAKTFRDAKFKQGIRVSPTTWVLFEYADALGDDSWVWTYDSTIESFSLTPPADPMDENDHRRRKAVHTGGDILYLRWMGDGPTKGWCQEGDARPLFLYPLSCYRKYDWTITFADEEEN